MRTCVSVEGVSSRGVLMFNTSNSTKDKMLNFISEFKVRRTFQCENILFAQTSVKSKHRKHVCQLTPLGEKTPSVPPSSLMDTPISTSRASLGRETQRGGGGERERRSA